MGFYQRLTQLLILITLVVLFGCTSENSSYFKITFTDEPNPKGQLAEYIEVSSQGKLVILSNRFTPNNEIYQSHHFIELNQMQSDSLVALVKNINASAHSFDTSQTVQYKLTYEQIKHGNMDRTYFQIQENDKSFLELISYCESLPSYSQLFDMDGSYYFNTVEFCMK